MSTVLCSESDVRAQANIIPGYTSRFDSLLPIYLSSAAAQIRGFCGRQFDKSDYTEYFMAPDSFNYPKPYSYWVGERPIEQGTLFLDYDPRGLFIENVSWITNLVENTDYTVDYAAGQITIIAQSLSYQPRGLRAMYRGGFAATGNVLSVPETVRNAAIMQTVFLLQRISAAQTGQSQEKANRGGNVHVFNQGGQYGLVGEAQALLTDERMINLGTM